jgi:hypothetical protein
MDKKNKNILGENNKDVEVTPPSPMKYFKK